MSARTAPRSFFYFYFFLTLGQHVSHPWQHLQRGHVEPCLLLDLSPGGLRQRLPYLYKTADAGQLPVVFSSHNQHRLDLLVLVPHACIGTHERRIDTSMQPSPFVSYFNNVFSRKMDGQQNEQKLKSLAKVCMYRTYVLLELVGYHCGHAHPLPPCSPKMSQVHTGRVLAHA